MSFKNDKFFTRAFSCFLAIVLIFATVMAVVKVTDFYDRKDAALKNLNIEFTKDTENFKQMISRMRSALYEVSAEIEAEASFRDNSYVRSEEVRKNMRAILVDRHMNEFSNYLSSVFLVDAANPGFIYEISKTYSVDGFFAQFSSEMYTSDFWVRQALNKDTFKVMRADEFSIITENTKRADVKLLPVVYKPQPDSDYALITFLDIAEMAENFGFSGVYDDEGALLYSVDGVPKLIVNNAELPEGNVDVTSIGDDYVFKTIDTKNEDIRIVKFVQGAELDKVGDLSVVWDFVAVAVFILLSLGVAFVSSARYSRQMNGLAKVLSRNSNVKAELGEEIKRFTDIYEGVKLLALQNVQSVGENAREDSVLNSLFLQSKMRDVYVGIDNIEEHVDISRSFFMFYLRVNYKEEFETYMGKDLAKTTFFLKQLIEMYIETLGVKATTFQIENGAIVSLLDVDDDFSGKSDVIDSILSKLSNESEYAFFTIAVSGVYNGIENVKGVYDSLIDLAKYAKPISETQVLYEGEVSHNSSHFYFSVEEMGKLSAILQNGTEDEVVHKVCEIIDYNIKKDINCFELYLLSTEIINCSVKLVNRILHTMPQKIRLSDAYKKLERASTPAEYRTICNDFLCEVMSVVRENKREDDYIISYILDYIDNHYAEDIYLNLFAEKLKLTGAYISSYFKEKMNVNLSDYLNNYRIKKAVELSENPQNKNKDIAVMVGLPNINTFIRLFKKYTGYTPGEYRKKHYGEDYKK